MVPWLAFVWASILCAAIAGFGYGALAFGAVAAGVPLGAWWIAVVQAHGHLQLFGWSGLMVLGVGFHFLPRLRGARLAKSNFVPWILVSMASGLALRALSQPLFAILGPNPVLRVGLGASGILELAAASLTLAVLAATMRGRGAPPIAQRSGLLPVLPYLIISFLGFWVALAINAVAASAASVEGMAAVRQPLDDLIVQLGLAAFLIPISVAISARSFPLFLWLRVPSSRLLRMAVAPLLLGLGLRLLGSLLASPFWTGAGQLVQGISFLTFPIILQILPLRRRDSRAPSQDRHYVRPVEWLLVPAYAWLAFAGILDLIGGLASLGAGPVLPPDIERHALGSGFITLLILGMGARMLPGFSGKQIASFKLVWATVWLGNSGALLRIVPLLLASLGGGMFLPVAVGWGALALSGVLDLAAVLCLGLNLLKTFRQT